jgi:hypothetical protein
MSTINPLTPYGSTVFCDDLRQEDNGKIFLIGVYNQLMYVPQMPFVAPRLFFRITFYEKNIECGLPLQFKVFLPGATPEQPALTFDVPATDRIVPSEEEIERVRKELAKDSGEGWEVPEVYRISMYNLFLSPFVVERPGPIRVRGFHGENMIRLGSMSVLLRPSAESPAES